MGLRFFHRIRLIPGVELNLSKSGPSLSFGVRGAHITVNTRGGVRKTVGIPGTGIYYTTSSGHHTGVHYHNPTTAATTSRWKWPTLVIAVILLGMWLVHNSIPQMIIKFLRPF